MSSKSKTTPPLRGTPPKEGDHSLTPKPKRRQTKPDGKSGGAPFPSAGGVARSAGVVVPRLRFPEFRGAEGWLPNRLGLALKFQPGFPFPSSGFNDAGKGLRLIRNRDLRSDDIIVHFSEPFDPTFVVNDGDVLVGMDGDFTPTVWNKGKALLNQRVGRILRRGDNDLQFLFYALTVCLKHIEDATARTTVKHLSHSAVEDRHEPLPSPAEQQKIAECLSSVDELVTAQAQKVDALKTHKKGLMQQLFPREGETQPRLRFPEFQNAGEWVEQPLGNFIEEFRHKSTIQDEYEVMTSARSGLVAQRDYYDNDRITKRDNIGFNVIPPNYMTYRSRSDDRQFYFNENDLGITGIVSVYYPVFRVIGGSNKFLIELLSTFSRVVGKYSVGTSQTVLSLNQLGRIRLPFPPTMDEQQRIASCLSSLDELITVETQELKALKTHKRGLMQQLFPSMIVCPQL